MRQKKLENDSKHDKEADMLLLALRYRGSRATTREATRSDGWSPTDSYEENVTLVLQPQELDSANH